MNIDLGIAAGYVIVAVGGFALGALAGRWMMGEMRNALGGIQIRLAALEHTVVGNGAAANSAATALSHSPVSTAPEAPAAEPSPAAALEHHARAVERLAAAIEQHAQAVDAHGAAPVAAAIEMGGHPAPVAPSPTFATPLHAAGVAIGASVAPVAAAAAVAATPPQA